MRGSKATTIIGIIITVIALTFSGFLIFSGSKDAGIEVNTELNQIEISGGLFYNIDIPVNAETEVNMVDPIGITRRTNGSSVGNTKKGYFTLDNDEAVYLCLGDSTLDWIEIYDGESYYYLNLQDEEETLSLYNEILALI